MHGQSCRATFWLPAGLDFGGCFATFDGRARTCSGGGGGGGNRFLGPNFHVIIGLHTTGSFQMDFPHFFTDGTRSFARRR